MALTNIEYGSVASSKILNDNFNYLESLVAEASTRLDGFNDGIDSKIATSKKVLQESIQEIDTKVDEFKSVIDKQINDVETDINSKINIKTTYINGSAWYRIWSDGWCEQGGGISTDNGTITLLKPFADTNYTCLCVTSYSRINETFHIKNKTTTTFHAQYANGGTWFACGQLAKGEY